MAQQAGASSPSKPPSAARIVDSSRGPSQDRTAAGSRAGCDPLGSGSAALGIAGLGKTLQLQLSQCDPKAEAAAGPRDADGNTTLHLAARTGDTATIAALLAEGADVNVRNSRWQTPLHMGAESGKLEAVQQLVQVRSTIVGYRYQ